RGRVQRSFIPPLQPCTRPPGRALGSAPGSQRNAIAGGFVPPFDLSCCAQPLERRPRKAKERLPPVPFLRTSLRKGAAFDPARASSVLRRLLPPWPWPDRPGPGEGGAGRAS